MGSRVGRIASPFFFEAMTEPRKLLWMALGLSLIPAAAFVLTGLLASWIGWDGLGALPAPAFALATVVASSILLRRLQAMSLQRPACWAAVLVFAGVWIPALSWSLAVAACLKLRGFEC